MLKRRFVLFAVATGLFATQCSSDPPSDGPVAVTRAAAGEQGALVPGLGTLSWSLPTWADPLRVPLVALDELKINDRARVLTAGLTMGEVASLGTLQTNIGVEATVGDLTSIPRVMLRDRSIVSGNAISNGVIDQQNLVKILGAERENAGLEGGTMTLVFDFPVATNDIIEPPTVPRGATGR